MDSNGNSLVEDRLYKIVGNRNGNGKEKTFFVTFVKQIDGTRILVGAEPGNIFYQYWSHIRSIKPATSIDKFLLYINLL